jgi:hypothetical protein
LEPLHPVLGIVMYIDFALFTFPLCTGLINQSLQFSCNFLVYYASEGSLFFHFFFQMTAVIG